jgi:predicted enzyme related to lactoylglutathione lyase
MDAVYYLTKDFKRARDFYEGALGLRPAWSDSTEVGDWVEYELADGNTFGLGYLPQGEFHPSGGVLFAVSDVKDAQERAKQAGATVVFDVLDTPACTMTWCVDTEGNTFCLHKLRAS